MAKVWFAPLHFCPSRSFLLCVTAVAMMYAAPQAFADPVLITGGSVFKAAIWTGSDPPFGFQLTGDGTALGGVTFSQAVGSFVKVGDTINLSDTISVSADPFHTGPAQQQVAGVTYSGVFLQGTLHLAATPATLTAGDTDRFDTPFTMDGSISLSQPDPVHPGTAGELLLTTPIEGRGTASMFLTPVAGMPRETSVSYNFAEAPVSATPEPTTLALLGGGLVVAVGRARAKRGGRRRTAIPPS
jgi:hypothetical protein